MNCIIALTKIIITAQGSFIGHHQHSAHAHSESSSTAHANAFHKEAPSYRVAEEERAIKAVRSQMEQYYKQYEYEVGGVSTYLTGLFNSGHSDNQSTCNSQPMAK